MQCAYDEPSHPLHGTWQCVKEDRPDLPDYVKLIQMYKWEQHLGKKQLAKFGRKLAEHKCYDVPAIEVLDPIKED